MTFITVEQELLVAPRPRQRFTPFHFANAYYFVLFTLSCYVFCALLWISLTGSIAARITPALNSAAESCFIFGALATWPGDEDTFPLCIPVNDDWHFSNYLLLLCPYNRYKCMNTDAHLYQQIAEAMRRRIAQGELGPGDRLPSMRDLAATYGCTPGTISRAYAILADEGLVTSHRGGGTHVADAPLLSRSARTIAQAALLNQAERFLLDGLAQGFTIPQIQSALSVAAARWQAQQESAAEPTTAVPTSVLRFCGSHDLTMDLLAQQLATLRPGTTLEQSFRGSLGGLMALARGDADLASAHLWDETTDTYNLPYVRRVLPGRRLALVTLVRRAIGLILPAGNPSGLRSLADLSQNSIIWVNRQPGSGTRVWLDAQLARADIDTTAVSGYDTAKTTHMEVAQAVARGEATAGLGISAAARAYGLDFVPLTQEVYQLVLPQAVYESPAGQALLQAMLAPEFLEAVAALGGYDTAVTGETTWT
jgi:molybdate-binding protein/DNA-binding transcriptional regulator YhcF (GntR family)